MVPGSQAKAHFDASHMVPPDASWHSSKAHEQIVARSVMPGNAPLGPCTFPAPLGSPRCFAASKCYNIQGKMKPCAWSRRGTSLGSYGQPAVSPWQSYGRVTFGRDVHLIYTLPVLVVSRHSRASGNPGDKRHGDWMPAYAGMTFSWHRTYETDIQCPFLHIREDDGVNNLLWHISWVGEYWSRVERVSLVPTCAQS